MSQRPAVDLLAHGLTVTLTAYAGSPRVYYGNSTTRPPDPSAYFGPVGSPVAPPLAGRSAAYLARQLLDIKTGARNGPLAAQMQGPARGLNDEEIRDLAVYAASLKP